MKGLLVRLSLRFADPADEREFFDEFVLARRQHAQAAMLLGSFVYYAFAMWDWIIDPVHWPITHAIRGLIVTPFLWASTVLLFFPYFQRRIETVLLLFICVPSIGLSVICSILERGFDYGGAGLIIILLFVFSLLHIRIKFFAVFCVVSWGSFVSASCGPGTLSRASSWSTACASGRPSSWACSLP
jgi:hypothetical protein